MLPQFLMELVLTIFSMKLNLPAFLDWAKLNCMTEVQGNGLISLQQ